MFKGSKYRTWGIAVLVLLILAVAPIGAQRWEYKGPNYAEVSKRRIAATAKFPDALAGLFLTSTEADFLLSNRRVAGEALLVPSPGLPGSGGLNRDVLSDAAPDVGLGVMWMITAQIDNFGGHAEVDVPFGGLDLADIPAPWVMIVGPNSMPLRVPAGSSAQLSIGGLFLYRGHNPPTILGLPEVSLKPGQTARLQILAYAWGMPLLRGVNPPATSPDIYGIIE
jgi:hypothetical protein